MPIWYHSYPTFCQMGKDGVAPPPYLHSGIIYNSFLINIKKERIIYNSFLMSVKNSEMVTKNVFVI